MLVDIQVKGKKYIFFVSFNAGEIASLLQVSQHQFHDLIIVNTTVKKLIATTTEGSSENLTKRTDIYPSTDYDETSLLKYSAAKHLGIVYNVAILNIDFFKPFNDECLSRVAACIASSFKR